MAIYRKIHVSFWADPFIMELTPQQKLFFLYVLTNSKTKQCGIYELPLRQIVYDTGFMEPEVKALINFFVAQNRLKYSAKTGEIALKNWNKYNGSESPKVKDCVSVEIQTVKDTTLIEYVYSIGTVGILKRNKNKNKNNNKNKNKHSNKESELVNIPFETFWDLYDKKVEKDSCSAKWHRLTDQEREAIITYLPKYVKATPEKKYRKNPETFLNNRGWEDEIIMPAVTQTDDNKKNINGTHKQTSNGNSGTSASRVEALRNW